MRRNVGKVKRELRVNKRSWSRGNWWKIRGGKVGEVIKSNRECEGEFREGNSAQGRGMRRGKVGKVYEEEVGEVMGNKWKEIRGNDGK